MSFHFSGTSTRRVITTTFFMVVCLIGLISSNNVTSSSAQEPQTPGLIFGVPFIQTNLVSDTPGLALVEDRKLLNPWGIAVGPTSPVWVVNNKSDRATLYRGDVAGSPFAPNPNLPSVGIPNPPSMVAFPTLPRAIVANTTNDFQVTIAPIGPQAAQFIIATEHGGINAWHPNFGLGNTAVLVRFVSGHRYTGLTIGSNSSGNLLFAADFENGKIDVFDKNFADTTVSGNFVDASVPAGFHPINIQNLNGSLYVAYAKFQFPLNPDFGFVRKFDMNGVRDASFAINNGPVTDPFGLALAPANFGGFSNLLFVGNSRSRGIHDASINAFNPATGALVGIISDEGGAALEIRQLHGLTFGNGQNGGEPNTLYFTAGDPDQPPRGLVGSLKPASALPATTIKFSDTDYHTTENAGHFDVTVTRSGDLTGTSTVNYATLNTGQIALGRLTFNPGESSKTFRVLIVDNNQIAGGGSIELNLALSNPTGAALITPHRASLFIMDNEFDTPAQPENILDSTQFFVRQQYFDFLNREPDTSGFNFWTNQITSCGTDQACIELKRINVSAAFFLSIEFQRTGVIAYLTEKAAFGGSGVLPRYGQFMRDVQALQKDYVFGAPGADVQLEINKQAFFDEFVTRPEFAAKYNPLSNINYVQTLFANAGLVTSTAEVYIAELNGSQEVPPNGSPAKGLVIFRQSRTAPKLLVSLYLKNLSSTETEAHIHGPGTAGVIAPVIVNLPTGQLVNFETTLTNPQFLDLSAGRVYVDVHTANFPNGEIRAQMPSNLFVLDMIARSLDAGIITRAQALRIITESEYFDQERNRAFVLMEYFGYLRRNPDDPPDNNLNGYNFWLNKLNQFNGNFINADMVKSFLISTEYRGRFGPP